MASLQVVLGLYMALFRTAIVDARRQVSKTRAFVGMIPVHVLTREVRTNTEPVSWQQLGGGPLCSCREVRIR